VIVFREVQQFRQWWIRLILASMPAVFGWGLYQQFVRGVPWGDKPMTDGGLVIATAFALLLPLWLWNVRLIIEVTDTKLEFVMWLMWRRRRIPLEEIERAEAVSYRPLRDYGGWGIRRGFDGWCYNVSGNRGVRVELVGGEKLLLGSQKAEELARAIAERKSLLGVRRSPV